MPRKKAAAPVTWFTYWLQVKLHTGRRIEYHTIEAAGGDNVAIAKNNALETAQQIGAKGFLVRLTSHVDVYYTPNRIRSVRIARREDDFKGLEV